MDTASVRANRVTANAAGASSRMVAKSNSGMDRGGKRLGNAPTVAMPCSAAPSKTEITLPTNMAPIMYGKRGRKRFRAMPVNSVDKDTATT